MSGPLLHHGRVVGRGGAPISGALVAVASGTAPTPEIAIRTNSEGRFRIALPKGRFAIDARAPDGAAGHTEVTVADEEQTIEIAVA